MHSQFRHSFFTSRLLSTRLTNPTRSISCCKESIKLSLISNGHVSWLTSRKIDHFDQKFYSVEKKTTPPPNKLIYPGMTSQFINTLKFTELEKPIDAYRVLDHEGNVTTTKEDPLLDKETLVKMYKTMVTLSVMDTILYDVQRQGRVSFYMTNWGEEAAQVGSAAALVNEDVIYGQYREAGVLMWRGFTLDEFMNQCYSNTLDYGKGRQMPVHYGSKKLNFQTISSPLSTQIPQAAGAGYAQKLMGQKNVTICYFGEGAASEGDFHAAVNFAAVLETPTIFFCRNNGWAISTPSKEQYRGDGIAGRGPAMGIATIRVDGNDLFAVYNATMAARKRCIEQSKPVLIEAMTYRVGHHSTSDDATRYRLASEVDEWRDKFSPIGRLKPYLTKKGWWNEEEEQSLRLNARKDVLEALKRAEAQKKPPIKELFTDVYDKLPRHLEEQQRQLMEHLAKYPENYPINSYSN